MGQFDHYIVYLLLTALLTAAFKLIFEHLLKTEFSKDFFFVEVKYSKLLRSFAACMQLIESVYKTFYQIS
jgi:hypothetical protein